MATRIEIDQDVWEELQRRAVPLVDTPNTVIRALLGLDPNGGVPAALAEPESAAPRQSRQKKSRGRRAKGARAPVGSLLPESEYELPILKTLAEMGGRGPTREIVDRVGSMVEDRLKDLDKQVLNSGDIRWRNRVQFSRLTMIDEGLLVKDSPRGTWEITAAGTKRVESESR